MVLTQTELIASLQRECHILLHLCGKVEPGMIDYRPTLKQRSTIELLRYLTMMGPVLVPSIKGGAFLVEMWGAMEAEAATLDLAGIIARFEAMGELYETLIGAFTEAELREEIDLFGSRSSRGSMLVNWVLSGHAAYRTQLFCYLKSCGREELGTMNLWAGMDAAASA
jgi:hypothetical protein